MNFGYDANFVVTSLVKDANGTGSLSIYGWNIRDIYARLAELEKGKREDCVGRGEREDV